MTLRARPKPRADGQKGRWCCRAALWNYESSGIKKMDAKLFVRMKRQDVKKLEALARRRSKDTGVKHGVSTVARQILLEHLSLYPR